MKVLIATIALMGTLGAGPQNAPAPQHHHHDHQVEVQMLARASQYRAVCSKGDLNAVFNDRNQAVQAAQAHQRATGHPTSVIKQ